MATMPFFTLLEPITHLSLCVFADLTSTERTNHVTEQEATQRTCLKSLRTPLWRYTATAYSCSCSHLIVCESTEVFPSLRGLCGALDSETVTAACRPPGKFRLQSYGYSDG